MDLEKRLSELEKRVAALEVQAQEQPKECFRNELSLIEAHKQLITKS